MLREGTLLSWPGIALVITDWFKTLLTATVTLHGTGMRSAENALGMNYRTLCGRCRLQYLPDFKSSTTPVQFPKHLDREGQRPSEFRVPSPAPGCPAIFQPCHLPSSWNPETEQTLRVVCPSGHFCVHCNSHTAQSLMWWWLLIIPSIFSCWNFSIHNYVFIGCFYL